MIVWVAARLTAWGQWVQTNRGLGSKGLSASWSGVGGGGQKQAFIPVQSLEMSRTDDWVRTLPRADQGMLLEVYCTPHTAIEQAATLGMSLRTLYKRLHILQVRYAQESPGFRQQRAERPAHK